jgi:nitronate monooxygenase
MCTVESPIHPAIKERIVQGDERQTDLIFRSFRNTARVARNAVSQQVLELEREGRPFEDVAPLVAGSRGRKVFEDGDPDAGVWTAGLVQGLIHDVPTCAELVERIVLGANEIITERLAGISEQTAVA